MANELIDLSKSGNLGINSENAFASLGYGVELEAEFCNGINLQFEAQAAGNAGLSAHLTEFFEAIIEIEAGVEVGIQIAAQLSPKILDEIGLIAAVRAYLKAYIRARLELQLTLDKIKQNITSKSTPIQYRIFEEFIDQIEVSVGVEANAQLAITAAAEVVCQARIFEEENKPAGFDFRANAEAAFMFGAGFDFFAMARFQRINDFFRNAKNILFVEIEEKIEETELFNNEERELIFLIWNTALDLIIDSSTAKITDKRDYVFETASNFLYDLTFHEINKIYQGFLDEQLTNLLDWMDQHVDEYKENINKLQLSIDLIIQDWSSINNFFDLLSPIEKLLTLIEETGYDKITIIKESASHIYFIGYLIDSSNRDKWKVIPSYVQDRFLEVTGRSITEIDDENDAYEYLEKSCFEVFLQRDLNGLDNHLQKVILFIHNSGLTASGFIQLLISLSDEDSKKKLLSIGFDVLDNLINEKLLTLITSDIKRELERQDSIGAEYMEVLIQNIYSSYSNVFIPMFKLVYTGNSNKKDIDNLSILANRFLLNFLGKNVSFLVNELLNYSTQNITDSINQCEQKIRGGSLNEMAQKLYEKVNDQLDTVSPYPVPDDIVIEMKNKLVNATNEFILDILDVARTSMGRETWSEIRIDQISNGVEYVIFNPDSNQLNFSNLTESQVKDKIDEMLKCDFLPDLSKSELTDLIETLQEIGLQQLKAFLFKMPAALGLYLAKILKILFLDFIIEILDELWEKLKEALEALRELIEELKEKIEELVEEIKALLEDIKEGIEELFNATKEAIDEFFDKLIDDLDFNDMTWLQNFLDTIWGFLSGDTQEEKAKKVLNELRRKAKQNLENSSFKSDFLRAAERNNFDHTYFKNWMFSNVLNSSIRDELAKIKFNDSNAVNQRWGDINAGLTTLKTTISSKSQSHHLKNLLLDRINDELSNAETRYSRYQNYAQHIQQINSENIQVNSPIKMDAENDDIPILGRYVYLDVDFGQLDIRSVLRHQLKLNSKDLLDPDGEISLYEWRRELRYIRDLDQVSPVQVKILLNGNELNLEDCEIKGNRLQGHIHKDQLKHGINDMFLLVVAPSEFADKQIIRHIRFYCDHKSKIRPSNSVYIDPVRSVISSMGDDHLDAPRESLDDKETVVITNNSDKEIKLDRWTLSDAAGHHFKFGARTWLKPKKQKTIYIGETLTGTEGWKAYHRGRMIAVLNNRGEFLKLEDNTGKVVSHLYTGSPTTNKHIKFISIK